MASKDKKNAVRLEHSIKDEFIHRFKANPFLFVGTVVVLVIVIVAFVFVPAIPGVGGRGEFPDLTFGVYNKVPVEYVPGGYFAQALTQVRDQAQYRQSMGYSVSDVEIWREAFNAAVVHTGILDEMKQAKYSVPAEVVDRQIAENPGLLTEYRRSDNTTKLSLWREVQEEIAEGGYRNDLKGFQVPSAEAAFIGAMASRERSFDLVSLPLSSYPDGEIRAYVAANQALFRVTRLSRITLKSEKEALQILAIVRTGENTFEDAAKTYSQDASADRGGEMDQKMAWELSTDIPDAADREMVISLGRDALSQPVKVLEGWAFFKAREAAVPADMENSSYLDTARRYLTEFERGRMEDWLIEDAGVLAAKIREDGFDEALGERNLTKQHFGPLPLNYGNLPWLTTLPQDVAWLYFLADKNEKFWQVAFSTPLDSPSEPLVVADSVMILYPVEETNTESKALDLASSYSSYWLDYYILDTNIRAYFITNAKLEDRFADTYNRYFLPSY